MKRIFLFLLAAIITLPILSKPVDENTAKKVAENYFRSQGFIKGSANLELIYQEDENTSGLVYFYIFSVSPQGFAIISGDDCVYPILGYSNENNFKVENMPATITWWLGGYKEQIKYVVDNNIAATEDISSLWERYLSQNIIVENNGSKAVSALISTKWDQDAPFNNSCPGSGSNKAVTGCIATAMAQVMKYHAYPPQGNGTNTYTPSGYSSQTVNFGNTNYSWSDMINSYPNSSSGTQTQRDAVALLMYHCGVSVNMMYGSGSSGAYDVIWCYSGGTYSPCSGSNSSPSAYYAFTNYFKYKTSIKAMRRTGSVTETTWTTTIKTELDNGRPVLYCGSGTAGGHAFICDGYDASSTTKFHFNWGWGGYSDGNFTINNLNPDGCGIGGASCSFNDDQSIIYQIEPNVSTPTINIALASNITLTPASITAGDGFNAKVSIKNNGSSAFTGSLKATIYTTSGTEKATIETKTSQSIAAGATNSNITFTTSGISASTLPAGTYYVKILYQATGTSTWTLVPNGSYTNSATLTVTGGSSGGTTTVFSYDFESCTNFTTTFSPCTTYEGCSYATAAITATDFTNEGGNWAYIAMNPSASSPAITASTSNYDYSVRSGSGSKYGASIFKKNSATSDSWFILPQISIISGTQFKFWAKSVGKSTWGPESFKIMVSTTNNTAPGSFTQISSAAGTPSVSSVPTTWTQYTYNLDNYNGQNIYLAIVCTSKDKYIFAIDDIEVIQPIAAPTANFTATPTTVAEGGSVAFTNTSTGNITSYSWTFQGGNPASSTAQNPPAITYSTAGTYNVSLTVTGPGGSHTKSSNITVTNVTPPAPVANFTAIPTTVTEGGNVAFTNTSTGNITSYYWTFQGGNPATSTSANQSVTYSTAGTYNASLTVTGPGGSNTKNQIIKVEPYISIEENILKNIDIYPNPNNGKFTISTPEISKVTIYDLSGRLINTFKTTEEKTTVDIKQDAGIYFIKIENTSCSKIEKIIIE